MVHPALFISHSPILVRNEYLAKMNNRSKPHGGGPLRRGAQCSRIGCIGLRPALFLLLLQCHVYFFHQN